MSHVLRGQRLGVRKDFRAQPRAQPHGQARAHEHGDCRSRGLQEGDAQHDGAEFPDEAGVSGGDTFVNDARVVVRKEKGREGRGRLQQDDRDEFGEASFQVSPRESHQHGSCPIVGETGGDDAVTPRRHPRAGARGIRIAKQGRRIVAFQGRSIP